MTQTNVRRVLAAVVAVLLLTSVVLIVRGPAKRHPTSTAAVKAGLATPGAGPTTSSAPSPAVEAGNPVVATPAASSAARESESSGAADSGPATVYPQPPIPTGWQVAGRSVQGRPILVKQFGHGPYKVLWLGGIHGDETEGATTTANLPAVFTAAGLDSRVTLTVIWDANPDGRAAHTRTNHNGVDLNRDFPASNFGYGNTNPDAKPLSQPESRVVHDLFVSEKPDLVVACHSWRGDQFVNYDGPAADMAARFSALSGFPVKTSDQLGPELTGSMGNWIGVDMGVPIITIEWLHGSDPVIGWQRTKAAVLALVTPPG